jgi:hypothetical protein
LRANQQDSTRHHRNPTTSRPTQRPPSPIDHASYTLAIRRLNVTVRVLLVGLGALLARAVVDGVGVAVGLAAGIFATLLIVALVLLRQGRRLDPRSRSGRGAHWAASRSRSTGPGAAVRP